MRANRGYVLGSSWRHHDVIVDLDVATGKLVRNPAHDAWAMYPEPIDEMVRNSILYVDELVQPINNFLPQHTIEYASYLEGRGALRRVAIELPDDGSPDAQRLRERANARAFLKGTNVPRIVAEQHYRIFKELDAQSPGNWAFGMVGTGMDLAGGITPTLEQFLASPDGLVEEEFGVSQRGFKIELTNILPVPPRHLGYDQILEFKAKRMDALYELRGALDDIYRRVSNDRDKIDGKAREVERLSESLEAVYRLFVERRWPITLRPLAIEVSLGELWDGAKGLAQIAIGAATFSLRDMAHGLASLVSIAPKMTVSPELRAGAYKYIYHALREGIVEPKTSSPM